MPVVLPEPKRSTTSNLPSLLASRNATAPPPVCGWPRPPLVINATYRSPLAATAMCRAAPRLSATTSAQNPAGSVMPPLPGSQAGNPWACTVYTSADAISVTAAAAPSAHAPKRPLISLTVMPLLPRAISMMRACFVGWYHPAAGRAFRVRRGQSSCQRGSSRALRDRSKAEPYVPLCCTDDAAPPLADEVRTGRLHHRRSLARWADELGRRPQLPGPQLHARRDAGR